MGKDGLSGQVASLGAHRWGHGDRKRRNKKKKRRRKRRTATGPVATSTRKFSIPVYTPYFTRSCHFMFGIFNKPVADHSRVLNNEARGVWNGLTGMITSDTTDSSYTTHYPLVNKQLDPENHQFLMETSLPTPMNARVYVNLPEGICD